MATRTPRFRIGRYSLRELRWFALLLLILMVVGSAIYQWFISRPPTLTEAFPTGEIVVGVDASFPPFAVDTGQGLVGIDIDLAEAFGEALGLPVRFVTMGYDGLYDSLISGKVDVIISALLINPARTRNVRYTRPYFDNGLVLVIDKNSPPIMTMDELPGNAIAFEYGSLAHSQVNLWQRRLSAFSRRPYELPRYALDAVRLDEADAALVDATSFRLYHADYPDWQSDYQHVTHAPYAVAVRQDREATWIWLDNTLGDLQASGRIGIIIDQHFADR